MVGLKKEILFAKTKKWNPGEQGLLLIITCPLKAGLGSTLVFADKDPVFSRDFNLSKRSSDIFVRRAWSGGWKCSRGGSVVGVVM